MGRCGAGLLALLALCSAPLASATVTSGAFRHDGRLAILIARPFGFLAGGEIELDVSDVTVHVNEGGPASDKHKLGFLIISSDEEATAGNELASAGNGCPLDAEGAIKLFTLADADARKDAEGVYRYNNTILPGASGEYSIFFANCEEGNTVVSFNIEARLYNPGHDYLSAGEAPLPTMYTVMCILYLWLGLGWAFLIYKEWGPLVLDIHHLMSVLVFFKALTVLSLAGKYHLTRTHGDPEGWNIAFYIFTFFRGLFLFTVIVLLGTGWKRLKPFLAEKERKVLFVVIPLQVLANIATIILDEEAPSSKGWFTWRDTFHLLDIVCCCAVLFPIVWQIKHLREAATADGKAARNISKLMLFRQFYVLVVSYIYFTRIVVYLLRSTTPFRYVWLSDAAGELATLAFYCVTGFKFRPQKENPYLHLEMDELDIEELELIAQEQSDNRSGSGKSDV